MLADTSGKLKKRQNCKWNSKLIFMAMLEGKYRLLMKNSSLLQRNLQGYALILIVRFTYKLKLFNQLGSRLRELENQLTGKFVKEGKFFYGEHESICFAVRFN